MGKKIPKGVDDASDIADFLFATKSIERIAKGAGTWGDLIDVGITAASFFIPPLRLASLPAKSLTKVILNAEKVMTSDVASVAAKRAASKTLDDALTMKRQGYIPTSSEPQLVGRTGLGEPTPAYQVTERFAPTEKAIAEKGMVKKEYAPKRERYEQLDDSELSPTELEDKKIAERFRDRERLYEGMQETTDKEIKKTLAKDKKFKGSKEEKTAKEVEALDKKTLVKKEEWDKTATEPVKGSSIQAELDDVNFNKDTLQNLLTLGPDELDREMTGKIIGVLRGIAKTETNPDVARRIFREIKDVKENKVSSWLVDKVKREVERLTTRAAKLEEYVADPTSKEAMAYKSKYIARMRRGKYDPVAPRSYGPKESTRKSSKAPDSPARSTLSELKSDEKSLMNMLEKESNPAKRTELRAELKRTRDQIFNAEVGKGRQYVEDTTVLRKELDDLRKQWSNAKSDKAKQEIKKKGQAVAARLKKLEGN